LLVLYYIYKLQLKILHLAVHVNCCSDAINCGLIQDFQTTKIIQRREGCYIIIWLKRL